MPKVIRENYDVKPFNGKGLILGIFTALILTQCGYTLQHRLKDVFTDSKGIFVPVFDNKTNVPRISHKPFRSIDSGYQSEYSTQKN